MHTSYNELLKHTAVWDTEATSSHIVERIERITAGWTNCYSYSLYRQDNAYRLEVFRSVIDRYNTLTPSDITARVLEALQISKPDGKLISYKQPPLDVLVKTYEPLVVSLAKQQHEHWRQLELEDLEQMCRMVICILYNSGYFVHKRLISKTFNNYVLTMIRKERYRPTIVSLDAPLDVKGENLAIKDVIRDEDYEYRMQDEDDREADVQFLQRCKTRLMQDIGARQYEQLVREYSDRATTGWGRKKLDNLKRKYSKRR